jgi:hypothetical protein
VKSVLTILIALTLLGSQAVIPSHASVTSPCCGNCGGKCCVKSPAPSQAAEPLAPAPAATSPASHFLFLATSLLIEIGPPEFSPPTPVGAAPYFPATQPLFQRHCVYLI